MRLSGTERRSPSLLEVLANHNARTGCRWLARCFVPGLIIDAVFVGTNRSLNVGLASSHYVSFAQIGDLLYAALALAVLARRAKRI